MAEFRKLTSEDILNSVYSFNYMQNNNFMLTTKTEIEELKKVTNDVSKAKNIVKLFNLMPEEMNFSQRLKSIKYTLHFFKTYDVSQIINKDHIFGKIYPSIFMAHVESPYQYNIDNKEGVNFASFNFYFTYDKKGNI